MKVRSYFRKPLGLGIFFTVQGRLEMLLKEKGFILKSMYRTSVKRFFEENKVLLCLKSFVMWNGMLAFGLGVC